MKTPKLTVLCRLIRWSGSLCEHRKEDYSYLTIVMMWNGTLDCLISVSEAKKVKQEQDTMHGPQIIEKILMSYELIIVCRQKCF